MKRTLTDYLLDLRNAIEEVQEFTKGMTLEEFLRDRKTANAVIRSLGVMGEAAKKIPEEVRSQYPEISWRLVAGMRDRLIHEYHGVDLESVWVAARQEAPPLKPLFEKVLREIKEEQ